MDEAFWTLASQVLEKGGPFAFLVFVIVGALIWLQAKVGRPAASGTESQMAAALKELSATVKANHEVAEKHREEIKDAVASHGERIAHIEGRLGKR